LSDGSTRGALAWRITAAVGEISGLGSINEDRHRCIKQPGIGGDFFYAATMYQTTY